MDMKEGQERMASIGYENLLPPRPTAPLPSDCCGTGCCPCVHDIYQEDLEEWKKTCKKIKRGHSCDSSSVDVISKSVYKSFEIVKVDKISNDSFIYTFDLGSNCSLGLSVGQHIILKQERENGSSITRQYTPISDLDEIGSFKILIKIYDSGKMTQIVKKWKVGDKIPWRGPFGSFKYMPGQYKRILLLAAGTGITPLYQIIKYVIHNGDETWLKLFYSSKSFDDILLRAELLELTTFWNFTMTHFLSQEKHIQDKKYSEVVYLSRISREVIKSHIMEDDLSNLLVLICGTKSYVKDMINFIKDNNIPDAHIHKF